MQSLGSQHPGQHSRPLVGLFAQVRRVTGTDTRVRGPPTPPRMSVAFSEDLEIPLNWGLWFLLLLTSETGQAV